MVFGGSSVHRFIASNASGFLSPNTSYDTCEGLSLVVQECDGLVWVVLTPWVAESAVKESDMKKAGDSLC